MLNNPLIPGDPYSYDLKWLVAKVKEILAQLGTLDEAIEAKIFEGFLEHSVVQFKTVAEMLAADITDGSIVLTLGYHEAGDQGGLFYLVKDFNPAQCALDYFLTLDNNKQIAIPVIVTPYVTPEMFGAYGNGTEDDAAAFEHSLVYERVQLTAHKTYAIDYQTDVTLNNPLILEGNGATLKGFTFNADGVDGIQIRGIHIVDANKSLNFDNCENVTVEDSTFEGEPTFASPRFVTIRNSKHVTVKNCLVTNTQYGVFAQVFQAGRSEDVNVTGCRFVNTQRYSYPAAVCVYEANNVRVTDCYFENIQHTASPYADGYGVYSGDFVYHDIGAITVMGCQFEACGRGIRIHQSEALNITGNRINDSIQQAILVDASPTLNGNTMKGAIIADNVMTSYVDIGGSCDDALVTGNDISGVYGVYIEATGTPATHPKRPAVIGNHIHDTERGGVAVQSADDPVVSGNSIVNFNTSAYSSSDYRSGGIGFNSGVSNPTAIGNAIQAPAAAAFAINFADQTVKRNYKGNTFDMATNAIYGGYNGAPTQGKWARGESVEYINPQNAGYIGAVCTVSGDFSGTAPTFRQYGALA